MPEFSFFQDEQQLAERLRREARQTQPEFSAERHDRIMQAVRTDQQREVAPVSHSTAMRRTGKYAAAFAVAAASLLLAFFVVRSLWTTGSHSGVAEHQQTDTSTAPDMPPLDHLAADVLPFDMPAAWSQPAATVDQPYRQEWDDLNNDAKIALSLVTDTLPVELFSGE